MCFFREPCIHPPTLRQLLRRRAPWQQELMILEVELSPHTHFRHISAVVGIRRGHPAKGTVFKRAKGERRAWFPDPTNQWLHIIFSEWLTSALAFSWDELPTWLPSPMDWSVLNQWQQERNQIELEIKSWQEVPEATSPFRKPCRPTVGCCPPDLFDVATLLRRRQHRLNKLGVRKFWFGHFITFVLQVIKYWHCLKPLMLQSCWQDVLTVGAAASIQ